MMKNKADPLGTRTVRHGAGRCIFDKAMTFDWQDRTGLGHAHGHMP
jgi:hypothetical protein